MIFNKKFLHAIEAVLDISINSSHSPTSAKQITKRQGIPSRYLEKILQELVRQKILKGTRGPNGGYTLGKEKRNSTWVQHRPMQTVSFDPKIEHSGFPKTRKAQA